MLGTRVAIKVLHPELARRTGLVERFLQEARVAAQIRSPHVVQVTDVDRTPDGHAYIVMELLEGEPLSAVLDRQRKLPVPTACEYTLQILAALEAAHALGVIHRDLKPENVFVTFAGGKPVLKLIDFGIAKARRTDPQQRNLTVAGVVMGTAEYMAPEQARSAGKVDARADLYAVGVMLYEMIAGLAPGERRRCARHRAARRAGRDRAARPGGARRAARDRGARAPRDGGAARAALRDGDGDAPGAREGLDGEATGDGLGPRPRPEAPATGAMKSVTAQLPVAPSRAPAPPTPVAGMSGPEHGHRAGGPHRACSPRRHGDDPADAGRTRAWRSRRRSTRRDPGAVGQGPDASLAMVALPVLLGAGVVMVLMATGTWSPGSEPSRPATTTSWTSDAPEAGALTAPPMVATRDDVHPAGDPDPFAHGSKPAGRDGDGAPEPVGPSSAPHGRRGRRAAAPSAPSLPLPVHAALFRRRCRPASPRSSRLGRALRPRRDRPRRLPRPRTAAPPGASEACASPSSVEVHGERRSRHTRRGSITTWRSGQSSPTWPTT